MHIAQTQWHGYRRVPASFMPRPWQTWVLDRSSLTKRLIDASNGNFEVKVQAQKYCVPKLSERKALGLDARSKALVREVELRCHGEIWVTARSVIPLSTLCGSERQLKHLGTKPLGAFLFASKSMRRGGLEVSKLLGNDGLSYARRSVFSLHDKPLLVTEYFRREVITSNMILSTT